MIVELGERLKQLRLKSGLNQSQIAKRLHLNSSTISGYESSTRYPSLTMLVKLAALYHVTTDYLLGYDSSCSDSRSINVDGLTDREIRLVSDLIDTLRSKNNQI